MCLSIIVRTNLNAAAEDPCLPDLSTFKSQYNRKLAKFHYGDRKLSYSVIISYIATEAAALYSLLTRHVGPKRIEEKTQVY